MRVYVVCQMLLSFDATSRRLVGVPLAHND
jgi:hypothetical protein